jgi:hypothetical protein
MAIVRCGPGCERSIVMLNGSKVSVDVEELPEPEIKSLSKQKRIKPLHITHNDARWQWDDRFVGAHCTRVVCGRGRGTYGDRGEQGKLYLPRSRILSCVHPCTRRRQRP